MKSRTAERSDCRSWRNLILAELPRFAKNPYVFAGRVGHINGMSKSKARFDKIAGVFDWTLHDLRRTARTLMSRVGVSADIAERVLGHTMEGIRGTYDWHVYADERPTRFSV